MVLARKWRPRSFAEVVGQAHVVRALSNALTQGRLHHAYLFTGTRGVGKTTLARILAKCLNCETGPTATPCGVCAACQAIEAGRFVDLIEIDAASYTGVDNMREVLENAQYAPTAGRYKVYIIDEVHMLSKSAFNAMLKTLEEPPAHVVFVLATTEAQKVPVTVLSRCLQFNLKLLPPARVAAHLRQVLEAEGVSFEAGALELIARAAAGSMRDALSLTDQAIAYGGGRVLEVETAAMLGVIDQAYLYPLLEALADNDGARLMREAESLAERSLSFDAALQDLAALLYQIALAQTVPEAVAEDTPARDRLFALARRLDAETVQLFYQIATLGRRDLEWAPDEYGGFCMTLLRMLAFVPEDGGQRTEDRTLKTEDGGQNTVAKDEAQPVEITQQRPATAPIQSDSLDWIGITQGLTGGIKQLAAQCSVVAYTPEALRLRLTEAHRPLLESFGEKLRGALRDRLGATMRIEYEFGDTGGAAPAQVAERERTRRQAEAEAAIQADPFVRSVLDEFGGRITQIKPLV
ncbi:MAG: DNA polymerase III subunit gamma/tau [Thiobacillaceae bacterium]